MIGGCLVVMVSIGNIYIYMTLYIYRRMHTHASLSLDIYIYYITILCVFIHTHDMSYWLSSFDSQTAAFGVLLLQSRIGNWVNTETSDSRVTLVYRKFNAILKEAAAANGKGAVDWIDFRQSDSRWNISRFRSMIYLLESIWNGCSHNNNVKV